MSTAGFDYHRPRTIDEALRIMADTPGARYVAGGTDLMVRLHRKTLRTPALVSLRNIASLREIRVGSVDDPVRIGAGVPLADVMAHPAIRERYPVLVEAIATMGSVQIRNVGTLGGNLCNASPCADTAPPLLVLEARIRSIGPEGERETPMEDFLVSPGATRIGPSDILTEIVLDAPRSTLRATFLKKSRVSMDLAQASVAVAIEMKGTICERARVAAGSVAPRPIRLHEVEKMLEGATLVPDLVARASEVAQRAIAPISDVRASAEFRRAIVGAYVKRAIGTLLGWRRS